MNIGRSVLAVFMTFCRPKCFEKLKPQLFYSDLVIREQDFAKKVYR